jgi:hypothetical protein
VVGAGVPVGLHPLGDRPRAATHRASTGMPAPSMASR